MARPAPQAIVDWAAYRRLFTPKLVLALREGYGGERLRSDVLAGLTVAILALPLSMAIAIGAGVTPDKGLVSTVVAGVLISALGGSRFQVGGPAAAFIVIVANIIDKHGHDGLLTATLLAGLMLMLAGFLQLGTYIKYVPGPVILGFTSGIGAVILVGQVKDFLGLAGDLPSDVFGRVRALAGSLGSANPSAFLLAAATLATIIGLRRWRPRWPGLLIAVVGASVLGWLLKLPVETIGTRFGGIPSALPAPALPDLSWAKISEVFPTAFTLAFLIGVESLLSAVAADAIAGTRHRSNMEVVAQGVANVATPLFGGLPATGVIARTGTNIAAGAATPLSGVLHALIVLAFMLLLAPLAAYLTLPCLAAVLVSVAWRLLDLGEVWRFVLRAPWDDRVVLLSTLFLTVLVDLNVAISVGVVLASMLFMHRMADAQSATLDAHGVAPDRDDGDTPRSAVLDMPLPESVRVFELRGPLFFGASASIAGALDGLRRWPRVLLLRMRDVPLIDATGISALEDLAALCARHECRIIMSGLQPQPRQALHRYGFLRSRRVILASNSFIAIEKAKALVGEPDARTPTPPARG